MNAARPPARRRIAESELPRLRSPRSILDLVNYQMHLVESTNSARVTRVCEGGHGITRREWRLLALLAAFGELAPSHLAERARLDRSRSSKASMLLLQKGLIERRGDPADRRRATVALTAEGRAIYERIFPTVCEINAELLAELSEAETRTLAQLLARLGRRAALLAESTSEAEPSNRRHGGSRRAWEREQQAAPKRPHPE